MSSTKAARTGLICAAVAVAMTGAAFAAVPLYKAFCQATGFAGTARKATRASSRVLDKTVTVYFDTNVRGVPWSFEPMQRSQTVKIGSTSIAFFKVVNDSDQPVTGRAAYNVSPDVAGAHVRKLQCFCFSAQTLQPRQAMEFPVIYYVDPAFASDPNTKGYGDIILSYTFVPDPQEAPKASTAKVVQTNRSQELGAPASGRL